MYAAQLLHISLLTLASDWKYREFVLLQLYLTRKTGKCEASQLSWCSFSDHLVLTQHSTQRSPHPQEDVSQQAQRSTSTKAFISPSTNPPYTYSSPSLPFHLEQKKKGLHSFHLHGMNPHIAARTWAAVPYCCWSLFAMLTAISVGGYKKLLNAMFQYYILCYSIIFYLKNHVN